MVDQSHLMEDLDVEIKESDLARTLNNKDQELNDDDFKEQALEA